MQLASCPVAFIRRSALSRSPDASFTMGRGSGRCLMYGTGPRNSLHQQHPYNAPPQPSNTAASYSIPEPYISKSRRRRSNTCCCSLASRGEASGAPSAAAPSSPGTTTPATGVALAAAAVASAAASGLLGARLTRLTSLQQGSTARPAAAPGGAPRSLSTPAAVVNGPSVPEPRGSAASPAPAPAPATLPAASPTVLTAPSSAPHPTAAAAGSPSSSQPAPASTSHTAAAASASASASAPSSTSVPLEGTAVPWATLGPSLELILQRFRVASATFRLVAPRDVDAVMDMYLEKGLLDSDPYWTRAWPSAIALAATLLQRPELVRGKVVADMGAGLGLAGMAAAMAGAREVVLLDREPLALQCALLSAAATGLDSNPESADSGMEPAAGSGLRQRRVIEPLPANQLPSYGALQLTPPYSHHAAGIAAGAPWEALLALARGLRSPAREGLEATEPSPGPEGSSPSVTAAEPAAGVFRAHVFDWTAPPPMDRLLPSVSASTSQPPAASASPHRQQQQQELRGSAGRRPRQRRFDVVLACDVLYEDAAVDPISSLMPLMLEPAGGRLLLADPPNRTVRNRERFLEELKSGPLRLAVEECSLQQCEVSKLDNEMVGGLAPATETVPVQFLVFRSCVGNDTVGVKL